MKKSLFAIAIVFSLIMITGVIAETGVLSKEIESTVEKALKEKGLGQENVKSVKKVNFEELPKQINIKDIDQTNLAMYEVDMGTENPVFVLTVSEEAFVGMTEKEVINKMLLNFGLKEKNSESQFLESAVGITGSEEKGYVMMRDGSINGISTNLEILEGSEGDLEIIIYKNSKEIGFRNLLDANTPGIKTDFDTQIGETIKFEAGDIISLYLKVNGNVIYKDVNTLIEISTFKED